jgi:hypothetical protein
MTNPCYRDHYTERRKAGDYIIMDNGACEGSLVGGATLMEAAKAVDAQEVVVPDVLDDAEATVRTAIEFVHTFRKEFQKRSLMVVPHGHSDEEWLWCADQLLRRLPDWEPVIGLPKRQDYNHNGEGRRALAKFLHVEHPEVRVHLLGSGRNLRRDLNTLGDYGVRSMDSAAPFALAQHGKSLSAEQADTGCVERDKSWTADLHSPTNGALAHENVKMLSLWLTTDQPR